MDALDPIRIAVGAERRRIAAILFALLLKDDIAGVKKAIAELHRGGDI